MFFEVLISQNSTLTARRLETWIPRSNSLGLAETQAIHQAKWVALRICYHDYMKQQEKQVVREI